MYVLHPPTPIPAILATNLGVIPKILYKGSGTCHNEQKLRPRGRENMDLKVHGNAWNFHRAVRMSLDTSIGLLLRDSLEDVVRFARYHDIFGDADNTSGRDIPWY